MCLISILNWYCKVYFQEQFPEVFFKIGVLKNFAKFTGKNLCPSVFFDKNEGLQHASLLKKRLQHLFSCEF